MTAYAFGMAVFAGSNGCKATLCDVSLDFDHPLEDGTLRIVGSAKRITVDEGVLSELGQIYFQTTTSNFGVMKAVTIKLNNCLINGNSFEARPDEHGNVFTLSMTEAA